MARKPELPGAADFFHTPGRSGTATDDSARDELKDTKTAPAHTKKAEKGPSSGADDRRRRGEGPAEPRLAPEMDTLSTEPPQTIQQPPTEKVTFYLPARMLQDLEICRVRLLTGYNLKVNRSQITQAALALTLNKPGLIEDALLRLDELARELQDTQ